MQNKAFYIPSIDGKDLFMALQYGNSRRRHAGYTVKKRNKDPNLKRYIAALDFSLDQLKLREVYENVYGTTDLAFQRGRKMYTNHVVNVTFKYAVREYNRIGRSIYVKIGTCEKDVQLEDHVYVVDGELLAIEIDEQLSGNPLPDDILGDYFMFKDGRYAIKKTPKLVASTAEVRQRLYSDGFYVDGRHYVRWKRSSGSARVGKCLFIDDKLYEQMHGWELCGLRVGDGDSVDLAALESYTSLPTSSIIDVLELYPQNILVIDDYESVFTDYVVSVEEHDGRLSAERRQCEIANSIWDGQGLIDIAAMGRYADKGMVLLRNLFFKCCCFNCNLQQWFADNGITDVSQLRGYTQAQSISDIKLITTPSSIKYVKFGSLEQWLSHVDPLFGVVKYDKKTHFFDGKMVHTHYQLLNTLQMTRDEVNEFLAPTFDYLQKLRSDPAVLRYHIKYPIEDGADNISSAQSKNDIVYKMLGINDKFAQTKLYYDFRTDIFKSFTKSLKLGHVCVDGNYSVLCGNPIEMLLASIGLFDGTSQIGVGNVYTQRFEPGRVLGSRSPHITCSNVWIPNNAPNELIKKYMNPTDEILYINSIGENVLNRLSGCDFDSDTVMLTNNKYLISAALKNDGAFPIAVSNVAAKKTARFYTREQQCDLDVKTSNNLIGEIINLSQELNTLMWHKLNNGSTLDDVYDIYDDICVLNVMSNIEIDKAKKEFNVNNAKELKLLSEKYKRREDGRSIKPNFFAAKDRGKGYYDSTKKNYAKHDTTMDYLQTAVNSFRMHQSRGHKREFIPFSELVCDDGYNHRNVWMPKVERIIALVRSSMNDIHSIYNSSDLSDDEKFALASTRRQDVIDYIGGIVMTHNTMIYMLKHIESEDYRDIYRAIFNTLFGYPNTEFYALIKHSAQPVRSLEFDCDGDIELYGMRFRYV